MTNMAFMPLYMWEMWDVTPVTNTRTDSRKVGQYSVWTESAKTFNGTKCIYFRNLGIIWKLGDSTGKCCHFLFHCTDPFTFSWYPSMMISIIRHNLRATKTCSSMIRPNLLIKLLFSGHHSSFLLVGAGNTHSQKRLIYWNGRVRKKC